MEVEELFTVPAAADDDDDDIVVPESPVSEVEEVNFGTDSEPHCIKNTSSEVADECVDIVPDSDDEGIHGTEKVGILDEMWPGKGGRCVGKRRYAPGKHSYEGYLRRLRHPLRRRNIGEDTSTRDSLTEKNVSSHKCEELNKFNCIESQEPGHSSEADALNFVDLYLSSGGDANAFHHVETGVLDRSTSSCILHPNGPQNLARIKSRTSIAKTLEVFDWSENLSDEEENCFVVNRRKLKMECEGNEPGNISKHRSVESLDIKKEKALGNFCPLNTVKGRLNSNKMEPKFQVEDEIGKGESSFEKAMDTNFVNELDKEVILNSPQKLLEDEQSKLDAVCTYDVGFDTQVAAEAMEALFYAAPLNLDPFCKHQSPQKTLQFSGDPSNSVSLVDHCNWVSSNSEGTGHQLMQSARKLCDSIPGNFETPQEDKRVLESELLRREICMPFSGKLPTKKRTGRRSLRNTIQHKSPQKTLQFSGDPSNSVSVDHCNGASTNSEGTGQQLMQSAKKLYGNIPGNFETPQEDERVLESELLPREIGMPFSGKLPTKKRTVRRYLRNTIQHKELYNEKSFSRQLDVDFNSFKVSNCGLDEQRGEIRKISSGTHRNRKQSSSSSLKWVTDQSFKKCPAVMKFNFQKKRRKKDEVMKSGDSKKASDSYMNRHQTTGVDEANIGHKLKLEDWNHPRGKRTRTAVPHNSVGRNNQYASCAKDNAIKCPIGNNALVEITGPQQSGGKCQYSSKKKHSINLLMQYSGGSGSMSVSNCKSAITSDKGISSGHDGNTSRKLQPADDLVSIVSDVMSTDRTLNVVPSRNCVELYRFKDSKKGRQRGKSLSRSSLTKELVRLGYTEMLPDFMPKDSRRGKGHANVRVLLSQNLDENIIRRQKKIVARLGFSIASCCSDASHFVADKFLRTKNMLEAIAIGIPVVTHLWLESCGQASSFIDEKLFILRDDKKEKEIGFSLPVSLALSRQRPLLRDHRVFITPNVKPSKDMIRSLVSAVQGQVVAETEDITTQGEIIVVSSEEDYTTCEPLLKKVYSSELLLNGIVTQRLEYDRHQLFKDFMIKDWPISHPN
ncbi:PREDICTED: uncharacterized protein LOC109160507 isoform X2 [Ipomoea nil]|uniref:uncharacterized protein LOC109160507 isoform X2 n=1 Tax=Ipomoea nil TaxID=35883 RepID=UPI000901BF5B|nr:PREDICTED: uncharacterized protein LOC109160507 isoform X2 [Ipomoea nil]